MKRLAGSFVLVVWLCSVLIAFAQDSPGEAQVRKAGDENIAAIVHGDTKALVGQYTDDYFRTGETGKVTGKSDFLKSAGDRSLRPKNIHLSDRKIRVFGDTAVETGVGEATYERSGHTEVRKSRYTVVWRKQSGVWKKAVYQATSLTPIPAAAYHP